VNQPSPLLAVRGLTKRFGGVTALSDVSFSLEAGEVHALCGENGAGKSTLIKLLGGIHPHPSYEGEILLDGKPTRFRSTADAEASGIAVIYQELALVPEMTVAENLMLGRLPTRSGLIDWNAVYRNAETVLREAKIDLDPGARIADLGVGRRQLCEIAKAIGKKSRILILDEPTAALTEQEVKSLLDFVLRLKDAGVSSIYISHKLDEVLAISDRVTVLRDGKSVVTMSAEGATQARIISSMVGRQIEDLFPRRKSEPGEVLLRVSNLSVAEHSGARAFLDDVSLEVRAGEVLGVGGLMGAGRSELLMHLFGAWGKRLGGRVELAGTLLPPLAPHEILPRGLCLVSEDRKRYGLVLEQTIGEQLTLSSLRRFTSGGLLDEPQLYRAGQGLMASLRIKAKDQEVVVGTLSGGNQQKVVLGKALLTEPRVLLLDEPTRGIDVGAKLEVYELINRLTAEGKAVILVSSELPELLNMSDRIVMLCEGRCMGTFSRAEANEEVLLRAAMGHAAEGPATSSSLGLSS